MSVSVQLEYSCVDVRQGVCMSASAQGEYSCVDIRQGVCQLVPLTFCAINFLPKSRFQSDQSKLCVHVKFGYIMGFEHCSSQTDDLEIDTGCFLARCSVL